MALCEFGIITSFFLHGKKTGLDNFMAICEFGDELGGNKTGLYCIYCIGFFNIFNTCLAHEYEQLAKKPGSLQEFFDTTKGRKLSMIVDFVISYNTLLVASRQVLNILKNTIQYIQ
jgi:hypothetical protein